MAANLLSIAETSQEIEIDEQKLRFIWSKVNVWDHFGISRCQYVSLGNDEKLKMSKGFYNSLLSVYFSSGKRQFCCNDCVWFDGSKNQDCIQCKVNVIAYYGFSESSDDEKVPSVNKPKINMVTAIESFDKQQKDLFDQENGYREGIDSTGFKLYRSQGKII